MRFKRLLIAALALIFGLGLAILLTPTPDFAGLPYSPVIYGQNGSLLHAYLADDQQWRFPPTDTLATAQKLSTAVISFEDKSFYHHLGVRPFSMARALWKNLNAGHIVAGGSTITMQVAGMAKHKPRSYLNKLLEVLAAIKLELTTNKKQILTMYLAHAPYGGNICGVEAASYRWFGRSPGQLSWAQAALLAVLPNAPALMSTSQGRKQLKAKRDRLLHSLFDEGKLDKISLTLALAEKIPNTQLPFKQQAPHFSRYLASVRPGQRTHTWLNGQWQQVVQQLVQRQSSFLEGFGVHNACAVVLNTKTRQVKAWVGSQGFYNPMGGQVDGILAARSTGSVLKPLLYGMAIDNGLLLPETMLTDIPGSWNGFTPKNADGQWRGLVSAKQALALSLNIPAVEVLHQLGLERFDALLRAGGLKHLSRTPQQYGLTYVIGGAEATPLELASLFTALGNNGQWQPSILHKQQQPSHAVELVSPGAAALITGIMQDITRPGIDFYLNQIDPSNPVAWKTGTSNGKRDAWAVGFSPSITVAVWVGNFTGEGNPALMGAAAAGPLLFDIFAYLPHTANPNADDEQHFRTITLCAQTGYRAGPNCVDTVESLAPKNAVPIPLCPYHKAIDIDDTTGYQVCSLCRTPGNYHTSILCLYPPAVSQVLRQRGIAVDIAPEHNPKCQAPRNTSAVSILYPRASTKLALAYTGNTPTQKLVCKAAHAQPGQTLYWYLDGTFMATTQGQHQLGLLPAPGLHRLMVSDATGNAASVSFTVKKL